MKLFYKGRPVHGRLVVVLRDGRVLGPKDIPASDVIEITPKELRWIVTEQPALGGKGEARP
jgi:hypothetical protein